jgi:Zn-dependent protease with chaperone function
VNEPASERVRRAGRLRLFLLILEGHAYLALIVAIFLSVPVFLVWGVLARRPFVTIAAILIGVPVVTITARVLRALWFPFPEPKGVDIGPQFGGPLYREVQQIARRIGAPAIHRVVVTAADNASALQTPRAGVFWPRNTLCLGYPLLATLSPDQVRAVIAHELGHMSLAHGRLARWVHRTRLSWMRLLQALEEQQSVPAHVYFLFRFYVPRLDAGAADVSREQELLADRHAADVTSREIVAQTLTSIEIGHELFDGTFWPRLLERVAEDRKPPAPFSEMGPEIWEHVEDREQRLERLMSTSTEPPHTHPALRDRLGSLGQPPQWPGPVAVTAADSFLGDEKRAVVDGLDRMWREAHGEKWTKRHDEIRARRSRLSGLTAVPSPTREQTFERGQLLQAEGDADAALNLYLAAHRQGHAGAGLSAGRILLERDDGSGAALIDAAMDADATLVEDGCTAMAEFLERHGRYAEARRYLTRSARESARTQMARTERAELSATDRFGPSSDPAIDAAALSSRLAQEPGVQRAFVVAKELRYSNGTQTVLAVLAKKTLSPDLEERLRREGVLPSGAMVIVLNPHDRALEESLAAVDGGLILDATRRAG